MWKFTDQQRIEQKELLSRIGKILFWGSLSIFLGSLYALSADFNLPYIETVVFFSQFSTYLGATLGVMAIFLSWNNSPFWDFIFNQLSIFLVVFGFGIAWWNMTHDKPILQGLIIVWIAFGLIGLGNRFTSTHQQTSLNNTDIASKSPIVDSASAYKLNRAKFNLQHPQTMKSVVGAIIWGFFGIIVSVIFQQPIVFLISIVIGLLVGVDKKQKSLTQNLKVALLKSIKTSAIGLVISALIGVCFTGLLFGFNESAILTGATFGGLIGLFFGALIGAL
ncbi:MAG: hypothetical protein R3D55_01135 [Chloroflexota bacterium]